MNIKKNRWNEPAASDITDYDVYLKRRDFLAGGAALALGSVSGLALAKEAPAIPSPTWTDLVSSNLSIDEKKTSFRDVTTYNNFYEFGTGKDSPARNAVGFPDNSQPWKIVVEGECDNPGSYGYDDFIKPYPLEERIYRMRCVEGWSMVIPWVGFSLSDVLKQAKPNSKAKFVEFTTLYDPDIMIKRNVLDWPYTEGLRIDEAMNPLTMLAVGLYGQELLGQNGAPIRLVVPWKYGFKSIKSIVGIRFVEEMPQSAWMKAGPTEYGFYSNVNPDVPHPRWSQSRERRIGELRKRKTLMFNGYADHVASLYEGMDLVKNF
jgi:sulfoxide reductase catalytic subunit YedY